MNLFNTTHLEQRRDLSIKERAQQEAILRGQYTFTGQQIEEALKARQQFVPIPRCIHPNCPICEKQAEEKAKIDRVRIKEEAKIAKKKKKDYDKRVKEWKDRMKIGR